MTNAVVATPRRTCFQVARPANAVTTRPNTSGTLTSAPNPMKTNRNHRGPRSHFQPWGRHGGCTGNVEIGPPTDGSPTTEVRDGLYQGPASSIRRRTRRYRGGRGARSLGGGARFRSGR